MRTNRLAVSNESNAQSPDTLRPSNFDFYHISIRTHQDAMNMFAVVRNISLPFIFKIYPRLIR